MKKLSIIALILVSVMVFTGCTNNELRLYNAFNKLEDITSMESNIAYNFTLEGEDFSEEEQVKLQEVSNALNSLKINLHQKTVQNKEKTIARALADMNMNVPGMTMDMKVWVDTNMSGDKPNLVEIIKMPPVIMNSMFPEDSTKEYIVYDFEKMMGENEEKINFSELMKFAKEIEPKISEFIKNSKGKFNPGLEIAKYEGERIVSGKVLDIYEVKLDDAAFKKLIRYTVNYSIENKDTAELIKEYMNLVGKMVDAQNDGEQLQKDEINKVINEMEKELPEFKEEFNSFMDTFENVKIIGDKGIVMEYGINSDGYIVHEAGSIPLKIDLKALGKALEDKESVGNGVLKLNINFNSKIYNINKPMQIDMPIVNEKNSINYMDFMKMEAQEQ